MSTTLPPSQPFPFCKDPLAPTLEYARSLDVQDPLHHLRSSFIIPTKAQLKATKLPSPDTITPSHTATSTSNSEDPQCIYFCGNSLGLQPANLSSYVQAHLSTWATKGVYGHFQPIEDSPLPPFLHIDDVAAEQTRAIVGAEKGEVAVMETLTANLHLLMASFYRPTKERYKIIMEGKAFPSDHYAVESQIRHHNLSPSTSLILINSPNPSSPVLNTSSILSIINAHASSTAILLLPGIQYYTGQLLDIPLITSHARSLGITVGWDLAHAIGNVPLHLHDWDVDFAVWCNYKYMNAGPGAVAGLFVHQKHGQVDLDKLDGDDGGGGEEEAQAYRPRLSGWWGGDKSLRFRMDTRFVPSPGAAGFQLGNPSALALAALSASLAVFESTSMAALREKSLLLTGYLEYLLKLDIDASGERVYSIITPADPAWRGAQLSLRLEEEGLLETVMEVLEREGVVVDERRPDVVRVAPAPFYNTFEEVWQFVSVWREAVGEARGRRKREGEGEKVETGEAVGRKDGEGKGGVMVDGGVEKGAWGGIK